MPDDATLDHVEQRHGASAPLARPAPIARPVPLRLPLPPPRDPPPMSPMSTLAPIGVDRPIRSARTGPRRHAVLSLDAATPSGTIDVDAFQELRRMGLFDDCGRNPPPSWWAR